MMLKQEWKSESQQKWHMVDLVKIELVEGTISDMRFPKLGILP